MLHTKNTTDVTYKLRIYNNEIETIKSVKLLGVEINYQIKFNKHISTLCSKAVMQPNLFYRLKKYKTEKNAKIDNFIYSNFSYSSLVWHFFSFQSSKKIESIQKCYLRLVLNDYKNDYATLLKKNNTTTKEIKILHTLAIEIFKTINNINPSFMKDMFTPKRNPKTRSFGILIKHHKFAKYGDKNLIAFGRKIWNQLPSYAKSLTSINIF